MSSMFDFYVHVKCIPSCETDMVYSAVRDYLPVDGDDYAESIGEWTMWSSNVNLSGSAEDYASDINDAIARALGREVPVRVQVTYVEEAPTDNFDYGGFND